MVKAIPFMALRIYTSVCSNMPKIQLQLSSLLNPVYLTTTNWDRIEAFLQYLIDFQMLELKPNFMENKKQLDESKDKNTPCEETKMVVNRNGFSNTFTLYQMMPVLFIVLMSIELGLILAALDSKAVKIIVGLIQLGMLVGAGVLWVMTTKIDPSDSIQLLHHKSLEEGGSFNFSDFKYFCQLCQTCVSKNAFHCRKCNRCVEVFDHHCKWLNNCIGAKNYFEFLGLISCSEILLLLHIIVNIVDCVARGKSEHPFSWIFYVEIVFCLLDVVILGFNTSLLAMHIYLVVNKKTTLQLIKSKRIGDKIYPIGQKPLKNMGEQEDESEESRSAQNFKQGHNQNINDNINTKSLQISVESCPKKEPKVAILTQIVKKRIRLQPLA